MIDILHTTVLKYGHCNECGHDDRAEGDDVFVFRLGTLVLRVCRDHMKQLEDACRRARERTA